MQDAADRFADAEAAATGLLRGRLHRAILSSPALRICLVVAPAGSGKTTLLTHVATTAPCPVAWLHARADDRSEEDVLPRLAAAVARAGLSEAAHADNTADLLTALDAAQSPLLVVIDDWHELAAGDAEAALERLILHAPAQVHFVVATRRPPGFDVSRLLASGEVVQLHADDLRFRSWEVEDLFRSVYGEPLSPEAAAMLSRRLGGWAAGLQLFHLSVRDRSRTEREASVAGLTGQCKLIRSYLSRNVVNALPPQRRDFLVRTSVLGVLTGPLCDALLERTGSEVVLRDLEREQFFTSSEDGRTYVYHQVLRNHLEVTLAEEVSDQHRVALLHAAGNLLEKAGHVQASARAFAQAGDWASVGRVVQQSRSLVSLDSDLSGALFESAPVAPDDPWLALARARRLLQRGSITDAMAAFRLAESLHDDPDARQRCAMERAMAGVLLPRWADHTPPQTEVHGFLASARAMTQRLPPGEDNVPLSSAGEELLQGLSHLLQGDWDQAEKRLLRGGAVAPARSWQRLVLGMTDAAVQCRDQSGADPTVALEEASLAGDVQGYPWLARVARGVMTSVVVVRKQEGWRLDGCRDLIESCRLEGDAWGQLLITLASSIAASRVGEQGAGVHFLLSAGELADALDAPVLRLWVDCISEAGPAAGEREGSPSRWKHLDRTACVLGIEDVESIRNVVRDLCGTRLPAEPLLHTSDEAVTVRCLGGFVIETSDGQVDLTGLRPRARTLLMALAADSGRDIHRERLEEMLWPGVPTCRAKHSLQVAVSSVRRALAAAGLGPDAVQRRGDSYRLHIDGATVDMALFEELVCRGVEKQSSRTLGRTVEEALAVLELYRGDLLPEVGNAEWVVWERDRLRQQAAGYAVRVAHLCLDASLHALGITAARRALELDPYQDAAWTLLAQLQEGARDATAAALTRARHGDIRRQLDVRLSLTQPRGGGAHERVSTSRQTR